MKELQKKYSNTLDIIVWEVSARTGANVNSAVTELCTKMQQQKEGVRGFKLKNMNINRTSKQLIPNNIPEED